MGRTGRWVRTEAQALFTGPQTLAFLPALTLAGYWIAGEAGLVLLALLLPIAIAGFAHFGRDDAAETRDLRDPVTGVPLRDYGIAWTDRFLASSVTRLETTACLAVGIDEFAEVASRHGPETGTLILQACADRIRGAMRDGDLVVRLDGPRFAAVVTSGRRADLETLIQLSSRIQRSVEDAISIDGIRIFVSASVGFATPRKCDEPTGAALIEAAEDALRDATANGTGMIRAFSPEIQQRARERSALTADLPMALETDQIVPFFQPQVNTLTGDITGFEVLARWHHPGRGLIPPGEFLGAAEDLGLLERLGEVMLYHTLNALRAWDAAGLGVPNLSVNFSGAELRNPVIVEKIRWELDRFEIDPSRLTIEVLETVIAQTANDTVVRNLRAFSDLGCRIDLDDFGTGHASIAAIKRFSVGRIKIDRSFVTHLDSDLEQQNIVAAILTLAQRLELDTLAEGVETPGEHAVLKQLGCDCVQGYGLAHPMPFQDVEPWVIEHRRAQACRQAEADRAALAAAVPDPDLDLPPGGRARLA